MIFEGSAMQKHERHTGLIVVLSMAAVIAGICSRLGGFGTGNCAGTTAGSSAVTARIRSGSIPAMRFILWMTLQSSLPSITAAPITCPCGPSTDFLPTSSLSNMFDKPTMQRVRYAAAGLLFPTEFAMIHITALRRGNSVGKGRMLRAEYDPGHDAWQPVAADRVVCDPRAAQPDFSAAL